MRINLNVNIVDLDGKEIQRQEPTGERNPDGSPRLRDVGPFTAQRAIAQVLTGSTEAEKPVPDGLEKALRFNLAMRVMREPEPELKAEDITKIKKLVGENYGPLVVGQVYALLDV